jgi:hypothetical protein
LKQYFSYIVVVTFIGGGNLSTQWKPLTCHKSLEMLSHNSRQVRLANNKTNYILHEYFNGHGIQMTVIGNRSPVQQLQIKFENVCINKKKMKKNAMTIEILM